VDILLQIYPMIIMANRIVKPTRHSEHNIRPPLGEQLGECV